uniref:Uncharacterized protein n=1 Tax=Anguilla anguilla TaxID=7936 RepID=A0A0E9Y0A7_ANGAN
MCAEKTEELVFCIQDKHHLAVAKF